MHPTIDCIKNCVVSALVPGIQKGRSSSAYESKPELERHDCDQPQAPVRVINSDFHGHPSPASAHRPDSDQEGTCCLQRLDQHSLPNSMDICRLIGKVVFVGVRVSESSMNDLSHDSLSSLQNPPRVIIPDDK